MSNIVIPWIDDIYLKLIWLPFVLLCVCILMLVLYNTLHKFIRPENLIVTNNILAYSTLSLTLSIVLYWYYFLPIIWLILFTIINIVKLDLNEVIKKENFDSVSSKSSLLENKNHELDENELEKETDFLRNSAIKKGLRIFVIFSFLFPVVIIVIYIFSGIGYKY